MGILSRINDIVRSNLNDLVSKAENPEKLLNQCILDMEQHLRKARDQVLDTVASEKLLEKKRDAARQKGQRWERRAELALRSGDEELARQALQRRLEQEELERSLEEQVKVQREYVGALRQSLLMLEERLRDARNRREGLIARARSARLRRRIGDTLSAAGRRRGAGERAFETFERMEERILAIEARAEALGEAGEPRRVGPASGAAETDIEARFVAIERGQSVEAALKRLRAQMAAPPARKRASD